MSTVVTASNLHAENGHEPNCNLAANGMNLKQASGSYFFFNSDTVFLMSGRTSPTQNKFTLTLFCRGTVAASWEKCCSNFCDWLRNPDNPVFFPLYQNENWCWQTIFHSWGNRSGYALMVQQLQQAAVFREQARKNPLYNLLSTKQQTDSRRPAA